MKILLVNVVCGIKSTGRICTDIAEELEAKGHEVRIAYGRENVPKEYEKYAIRIGNDFVVALHAFRKYFFDGDGEGSKYATIEFVNWIREYDPDVDIFNLGLDITEMMVLFYGILVMMLFDRILYRNNMQIDAFLSTQNLYFKWGVIILNEFAGISGIISVAGISLKDCRISTIFPNVA